MTIEEAIRQLKSLRCDRESFIYPGGGNNEIYEDDIAAIDTAIETLEKRLPKKPVNAYCPNCKRHLRKPVNKVVYSGRRVNRNGDAYCPSCGQTLDWSDEA